MADDPMARVEAGTAPDGRGLGGDASFAISQEVLEQLAVAVAEAPGCEAFPALAEAYRRSGQVDAALRVARAGLAEAPDSEPGRSSLMLALLDLGELDAARSLLTGSLDPYLRGSLVIAEAELAATLPASDMLDATTPAVPVLAASELEARDTDLDSAFGVGVDDAELDSAFDAAEPEADQMFDVNRVAEQVLADEPIDVSEAGFSLSDHPSYATETMASLLEQQGDIDGAESIRARFEAQSAERSRGIEPTTRESYAAVAEEAVALQQETDAAVVAGVEPSQADEPLGSGASAGRILDTLESWLENIRREVA